MDEEMREAREAFTEYIERLEQRLHDESERVVTLKAEIDRRRKQEQEDLWLLQEAAEMIGNYGTSTYQDIMARIDEAKAEEVDRTKSDTAAGVIWPRCVADLHEFCEGESVHLQRSGELIRCACPCHIAKAL